MLSRRHARLEVANGAASVRDLPNINGTSVNGALLRGGRVALADGDLIVFGRAQGPEVSEVQYTFHTRPG